MSDGENVAIDPADYVAIQQLLGRYCQLVDAGDAEGWADLFLEDGEFVVEGGATMRGRAQLAEIVRDVTARECIRHWIGAPVVTSANGVRMTARTYQLNLNLPRDGGGLAFIRRATTAEWTFAKADGAWRIARRSTRVDAEV